MKVTNKMNTTTLRHEKASNKNVIEWVDEIWYSYSIITNQMILNSIKYAGISRELGRSEDD